MDTHLRRQGRDVARPTKYNDERAKTICDNLRIGCTRRASFGSAGINHDTFAEWLKRFPVFSEAVTRAEDEAEKRYTGTIAQAAAPHDVVTTNRTVKTVYKTKKTRHKDGTVVEEPVALQEVSETTTTSREFDWRAGESWLKRRRKPEWGDSIDVRRIPDDQLLRMIALETAEISESI